MDIYLNTIAVVLKTLNLTLRPALEVGIVAKGTEVLAAVVMMVLDHLRLLLGDVARLRASFLPQPLLSWESFLSGLRMEEQEIDLIVRMVDNAVKRHQLFAVKGDFAQQRTNLRVALTRFVLFLLLLLPLRLAALATSSFVGSSVCARWVRGALRVGRR